jgi:hypothetical protein
MENAIPQQFSVVFDQLVGIVKDYVGGHSEAYLAGISKVAGVYVDTVMGQLLTDGTAIMVSPSVARSHVPDRLRRLHNPNLDGLQPEVVDSVTEDFEAAVRDRIVELVPTLSFFGEGRRSNFVVFVLMQAAVTAKERSPGATLSTPADLISALQALSSTVIENTAVETISKVITTFKNNGQPYPPSFGGDALSAIRAIKMSGSPRSEQTTQTIEQVESAIMHQLMPGADALPGPVLH